MKREIFQTLDGSTSIHLPEWNESYHSKHGAIQEAYHVFISNGLSLFHDQPVSILEIGFGTGLNAFITFLESSKKNQIIDYVGVEAYPISSDEVLQMNYVSQLNAQNRSAVFKEMHLSNWNEKIALSDTFSLTKRNGLKNPILLGRKLTNKNFLINTRLKNVSYKLKKKNQKIN